MERYQPDQYGRMMLDAHGQWVSLRAAEITALDAAQKSSADAQATVEALQRERDEWRSNAVAQEARANDLERDCKDLQSDIEDERAKAGNLSKKIAYWEKRHRTYKELAEENMNCKQASIDAHKDAYDELESQHADLHAALDAEREKVKGLHEITKVICTHCCEPMEIPSKAVLQTQLSQLQALVRALVCTRTYMVDSEYIRTRGGSILYICSNSISAERLGALLAYRATLDATTTEEAPVKGGDGE